MTIVDPIFLEETKAAFAQLTVDLVVFCKKKKIDHTDLPILPDIARIIRIIESL
jgi:hypothetical protein